MLSRDAQFGQSSQFFLAANLSQLGSRQVWILGAHIPRRQGHDIDLISVRLQHRERAMRKHVVVGMGADQHGRFSGPLLHRSLRSLFLPLSGGHPGRDAHPEHQKQAKKG